MSHQQSALIMGSCLAVLLCADVAASGFALIEQSASCMGSACAGAAASAEDASTIFFNPAGMSLLSGKQGVLALHVINPSAKFSDSGSVPAAFQPNAGGNGGDAGSLAVLPNAYFVMDINPQMKFGLGVNSPFGLQTEYDPTWVGRFQAIKSKIQTVNLNPALSFQINDAVSIGTGLNYQRIDGELSSAINYAAIAYAVAGGGASGVAAANAANAAGQGEGLTTFGGDDAAWGYNLGILLKLSEQTRVGLAYRSVIKYNLSGSVNFSNRPTAAAVGPGIAGYIAANYADGPVSLAVKMPDSFSASMLHRIDDKWDIMADASWTRWSVLQQLDVMRTDGTTLSSTPENWKNTWRVALGANHHYNAQWTSRVGFAYDQSPVSDTYRTERAPDSDRTWLTFGGQYKPNRESAVDIGYAHLFVRDATINQNQSATGAGTLTGNYKSSVDILSMQYMQSF